jgi:hypothetical protein
MSESVKLKQYIDCVVEQVSLIHPHFDRPFIKKMYKDVSTLEQTVLGYAIKGLNTQPTKTITTVSCSSSTQPSGRGRCGCCGEPAKPKTLTNQRITDSSSSQSCQHESSVIEAVQKPPAAGTSNASTTAGSSTQVDHHRREFPKTTSSTTQELENVEEKV